MATNRTFIAEVETVYHKDYQCDYYRGVVIDEEDNIVERCSNIRRTYALAKEDAEAKVAGSILYARYTTPEMREKLEEYKRRKQEKELREAVCVCENKGFMYIYDGGLYRYRYFNQNSPVAITLSRHGYGLAATYLERRGEEDRAFYSARVKRIEDIEGLPGHKKIWKIERVLDIRQKKNKDVQVEIQYRKFRNFVKDYSQKLYRRKITIKRKCDGFNELMDRFEYVSKYF